MGRDAINLITDVCKTAFCTLLHNYLRWLRHDNIYIPSPVARGHDHEVGCDTDKDLLCGRGRLAEATCGHYSRFKIIISSEKLTRG